MDTYNASQLKKMRRKNGLTQRQVADYLHMDRSTYAYYEIGQTKPTIELLIDLSHLYNVKLSTLLGDLPAEEVGEATGMLFSQLKFDEQKLVILFRSGSAAQREAVLGRAKELTK